jgi:hypothetical protein
MLSVERAFVLHLDDDADPASGLLRGRAEHVTSGIAGRFESVPELLELLARVVRRVGEAPER